MAWIKNKKGLSLAEILVALSLIGLIGLLVASVYVAHFKLFSNQSQGFDVADQTKLATADITKILRESQAVITQCPANKCPGEDSTQSGTNTIVLQLWSIPASGDPSGTTYDYIIYKIDTTDPKKLIKKTFPDPSSTRTAGTDVLASLLDTNGLTFNYFDDTAPTTPANATKVDATVATKSSSIVGKTQTSTKTTTANLRNK